MTCYPCLLSPSRFRHHANCIPISGHPSFLLTHSHFFNLLLTTTVSSCHPSRFYPPSALLSIRIITKPCYQTFHIHLGPLHTFLGLVLRPLSSFRSVKLLSCFATSLLLFALRKPCVQRWQSPLVPLMFKLAIFFSRFNWHWRWNVDPSPFSGTYSPYCEYTFRHVFFCPRYFLWGWHVDLGEVDWRLVRVRLLILCFLVAPVVDDSSKTQTDQAKNVWRIEPQVPHCQYLNSVVPPLR